MAGYKYKSRKGSYTRKRGSFKKRAIRNAKKRSLVKLIKSVSLKNAETKNTHQISENNDINHNTQYLTTNLLYTRQGISDNNTGTSSYSMRVGDEVIARGMQFKLWFANKKDRPNVMYKVVVFKYYSQSTPPTTIFKSQGSSNLMIRDIDVERFKILKVKMFNLQVGISNTGAEQGATSGLQKEAHKYVKIYIPLKNTKVKYIADDSGTPMKYDIGIAVMAYDSYGTLTTDTVGSYAIKCKFYFKDP